MTYCDCGKSAKYKCPKCLTRTCSLECSQMHKINLDCNGIRDEIRFVPAKDLNQELQRDFCLLEGIRKKLISKVVNVDVNTQPTN